MRKMGKYEAPAPRRGKSPILQTYFTSLVSLVLCAVMFLGTTFAWFTSDVTSAGNEIYIGILSAGLYHEDVRINDEPDHKVFDANTLWEANYTAVETLTVRNEGELAFNYRLGLSVDEKNSVQVGGAELGKEGIAALAKLFTVWVYPGKWDPQTVTSYDDLIAEGSGWTQVGGETATLADILEKGTEIAEGALDIKDQETVVSVALHLDKEAGSEIMGQKLSLNVRLIASQKSYESDAFGPGYDLDGYGGYKLPAYSVAHENLVPSDGKLTLPQSEEGYRYVLPADTTGDLTITVAKDSNVIIDGSQVTGQLGQVKVDFGLPVDNYSDIEPGDPQSGSYYIYSFKTAESISSALYNAKVVMADNKVQALDLTGGNAEIEVVGNEINGGFTGHARYDGSQNEYGLYLHMVNYKLTFTDNKITDTKSHAVGINGRGTTSGTDFGTNEGYVAENVTNEIVAFSNNVITVNSTEKDGRAALKIWADDVYRPESAAAEALMEMILSAKAENVITLVQDAPSKGSHVNFEIAN